MNVSKISVVTVCLNCQDFIRLTIESVASQTFNNIEHIIIDGGSIDNTINILQEYELDFFLSEKDNGVYDAMDKGAKAAKGDIVIFLNAGDTFFDNTTCEKVAAFFNSTHADIVFGNLMPVYLKETDTHDHKTFQAGKLVNLGYVKNRRQLYDESIHHQATFYRHWVLKKCTFLCPLPEATGEYNVLLNAVMKHNASVKHIKLTISRFVLGGISTQDFTAEWNKYVNARNILRELYCPKKENIKIKSETEFSAAEGKNIADPEPIKSRFKRVLKGSSIFRLYERIFFSISSRIFNLIIPEIDNLIAAHAQRLFAEFSKTMDKQTLEQKRFLENEYDLYDKKLKDARQSIEHMGKSIEHMGQSIEHIGQSIEHMGSKRNGKLDQSLNSLKIDINNTIERNNKKLDQSMNLLKINFASLIERKSNNQNFFSSGFRVFSQWDEDGLIQYLITHACIKEKTFVEIGVGDYSEANTRYLVEKYNWTGLIVDADPYNIKKIKSNEIYWKHSITAVSEFVDRDNINQIISSNKMEGEIGLLSIDVDGVDYWIWDAINVISPMIVICEYNSIFGSKAKVTVPYDKKFDRRKKHYSYLYAGASLKALIHLGKNKSYSFVGINSGGNNAFFVRNDILQRSKIKPVKSAFKKSMFRESRNPDGTLSYMDISEGIKLLEDLIVYDLDLNKLVRISDIHISFT
jgi:glycosyltransferase involved in cell wall biosynthesis